MQDHLINEQELLKRLPVCRRTLVNWRVSGVLPYIRPRGARRILYHWPSVQAALLRHQQNGGIE